MFTGPIYGWKGSQNGVLLGVLGIASLPVSFLVGYISPHVSDRSLTLAAVIVTGLGAALCTQAGLRRLAVAYFGGGGMLYLVRFNPCGPGSGMPKATDLVPDDCHCKEHCQRSLYRAMMLFFVPEPAYVGVIGCLTAPRWHAQSCPTQCLLTMFSLIKLLMEHV